MRKSCIAGFDLLRAEAGNVTERSNPVVQDRETNVLMLMQKTDSKHVAMINFLYSHYPLRILR